MVLLDEDDLLEEGFFLRLLASSSSSESEEALLGLDFLGLDFFSRSSSSSSSEEELESSLLFLDFLMVLGAAPVPELPASPSLSDSLLSDPDLPLLFFLSCLNFFSASCCLRISSSMLAGFLQRRDFTLSYMEKYTGLMSSSMLGSSKMEKALLLSLSESKESLSESDALLVLLAVLMFSLSLSLLLLLPLPPSLPEVLLRLSSERLWWSFFLSLLEWPESLLFLLLTSSSSDERMGLLDLVLSLSLLLFFGCLDDEDSLLLEDEEEWCFLSFSLSLELEWWWLFLPSSFLCFLSSSLRDLSLSFL